MLGTITTNTVSSSTNTGTISLPKKDRFRALWINVEYTSTASAGNRQVAIQLRNKAGTVLATWKAAITQGNNEVDNYKFFPGTSLSTAINSNVINIPIPPNLIVEGAHDLYISDLNNVDANDSFEAVYQLEEV